MLRIALGFEADWAAFCVPRDGDIGAAVARCGVDVAVMVVAADREWERRFEEHGLDPNEPAFNPDHTMNPSHRERCRRGDLVHVPGSILHNNACCPGWPAAKDLLQRQPGDRLTSWGLIADVDALRYDTTEQCWLLDNGEYSGPVFYCPWCSAALRNDGTVGPTDAHCELAAAGSMCVEELEHRFAEANALLLRHPQLRTRYDEPRALRGRNGGIP